MVANNLGITLLPKMAVDAGLLTGTGLVAKPLDKSAPARQIALVWRPTSPRAGEFDLLAQILARFASEGA
jgi:LysR family hydrogen peroxide-inducible transcriptional activator